MSGIFIRFKNPDTGKTENRTFEDLPKEDQERWLASLDTEALKRTVTSLADTLREICDEFDITREP